MLSKQRCLSLTIEPWTAQAKSEYLNAFIIKARQTQDSSMSFVAAKSYVEYRNKAYWVDKTRISLDSIVYSFQNGLSPESIVQAFPLLRLEQVYGAIAFYLAHRAEIDTYLADEEAAFDAMPQPLQASDPALYTKLMTAKNVRLQVGS